MALYCLVVCLIVGMCSVQGVNSQGTVTWDQWIDVGDNATLYCTSLPSIFHRLQWIISSTEELDSRMSTFIMQYINNTDVVVYAGGVDRAHYALNKTHPRYPLTIIGFTEADSARYWCHVEPDLYTDIPLDVHHRVPPGTLTFTHNSYNYGNNSYNDGASFPVGAGDTCEFTCTASGIAPKPTFVWTLSGGGTNLSIEVQSQIDTPTTAPLMNSTSYVMMDIDENPATLTLVCRAYNNQDGSNGASINVTLEVRVPPKSNAVKLSDDTGDKADGDTVTVDQGTQHVFTCKVEGTRPAATIQWYVDNVTPPSDIDALIIGTPTNILANGLFDTTGTLTFTPSTADHRKELKCEAYTTESEQPYPDSTVTLNVNARPVAPSNVKITNPTEDSLTVVWEPGNDGGNPQRFEVRYLKTSDSSEQRIDKTIPGDTTTYTVTGLEPYTEYEIRVYAINDTGMSLTYGSATGRTLPEKPDKEGFTINFNSDDGTVEVDWPSSSPKYKDACIQLEVKYQGNPKWQECGECIPSPQTVTLSTWCSQQQRRKRQATGEIVDVQAKLCYDNGNSCGAPVAAHTVRTVDSARNNTGLIIGIVAGCLLLMFAAVVLIVFVWKKKRNTSEDILPMNMKNPKGHPSKLPDDQSPSHNALEMEVTTAGHKPFPRDQLTIVKELSDGAFGVVFLAEATGIVERSKTTLVAVKSVKERASASDKVNLIVELELMKRLPDHHNVVKLLGFCVQQDPPYIIVEYLSRGNLKDLLADSRSKGGRVHGNLHGVSKSLTSNDLMKFAVDVADGMQFISSQQCVHRDLAARNVLVAEDMTCKVSDFGLACDVTNVRVYERTSEGNLPLRWMALESILNDTYTTESDAWSYGVLLWEIVTLGARPYPAMSAKTIIKELQSGYRMPKPQHCQQEIYDLMLRCWEEDPDWRPKFETISRKLKTILNKGTECISVKKYEESIYEATLPKDDNEKV